MRCTVNFVDDKVSVEMPIAEFGVFVRDAAPVNGMAAAFEFDLDVPGEARQEKSEPKQPRRVGRPKGRLGKDVTGTPASRGARYRVCDECGHSRGVTAFRAGHSTCRDCERKERVV